MAKWAADYPVRLMCRVLQVNKSAYYAWKQRGAKVISADTFALCARMKALFRQSRESLGSRGMMKQLRKEGVEIGRYRVRSLMKQLGLVVKVKRKYRVAIELFAKLGYQFLYAPNIAPDKENGNAREGALGYSDTPERERFEDVLLLDRLRTAVARITVNDPEEFAEIQKNAIFFLGQ